MPRRSINANRDSYDGSFSAEDNIESWPQTPSLQSSPPNLRSLSALPLPSNPPNLLPPVFDSYQDTQRQPLHHYRASSDSTHPTQTTFDSQLQRASSATSFTSHLDNRHCSENGLTDSTPRFFCPDIRCDRIFERASDQKRHVLAQHEGKSQTCTLCQRTYKRPYVHKRCGGRASQFSPPSWNASNNYGCGLCPGFFKDFDKWIRHVQLHQKGGGVEMSDWDPSLELQNLLQNHDLVDILAYKYSSFPIASMTWLEEHYHEAKAILESIDRYSLDRLQTVFSLATPLRNPVWEWPIPNHLTQSRGTEAPENFSSVMNQETEVFNANSTSLQPNAIDALSVAPGNFAWERRAPSLQQREQNLEFYDAAIAGRDGPEGPFIPDIDARGSQPFSNDSIEYIHKVTRDGSTLEDTFSHSHFDEAWSQG